MSRNLTLKDSFLPLFTFPKNFENFFNEFYTENNLQETVNTFKLNFSEKDNGYEITAEIPGVNKEDILVEQNEGVIRIAVEKKEEKVEENKQNYLRKEIIYGKYERLLKLPDNADIENITANYENGHLKINILKKENINNITKIEVK